jgi:hypothetical protein
MKQFKFLISIIIFWAASFVSAQEIFQLDSLQWNYQIPDGFEISESHDFFLTVLKPEEKHVNNLNVSYLLNPNIPKLTLEIYVFSLVDTFKKGYNTPDFSADVQMERKKINGQVFYLIRSHILHQESNYQYVSDVYLAEINGKEFNVTITYDNDDDKMKLEESFFNSFFS